MRLSIARSGSLLVIASFPPLSLTAQGVRQHDPVVLKYWAAPLFWQPSAQQAESIMLRPEATTAQLPTTPLVFVGITPCRLVDTRAGLGFSGAFGPPGLIGGASRTFPIQASTTCTIPPTALAYSLNVTVVTSGIVGYITMYPTGQPLPLVATLTDVIQGNVVSNSAIVPAGTGGSIDVYASNATDLVIDINGYYVSATDANHNTSLGTAALAGKLVGANNTAVGEAAMQVNTSGNSNTAIGTDALQSNTIGNTNTAIGVNSLNKNTEGNSNTAVGNAALQQNTTGFNNTALGDSALNLNILGYGNTAVGSRALSSNTIGNGNIAVGGAALPSNMTGNSNIAIGTFAMLGNSSGLTNVAVGDHALMANTTGNNNIAIGAQAGINAPPTSSNNIHIGSQGSTNDANTIRVGASSVQNSFFAAGIRGITTGNADAVSVVIDSNGQLGTTNSSGRYKEDIQDMGNASSGLLRLRPVTFRYQKPFADGSKPIQYGLIAEEVAKVYPDLVAHSADGKIETVKYQVLDSMLLNEVQKQQKEIRAQQDEIRQLSNQNQSLQDRLARLEAAMEEMASGAGVQ